MFLLEMIRFLFDGHVPLLRVEHMLIFGGRGGGFGSQRMLFLRCRMLFLGDNRAAVVI